MKKKVLITGASGFVGRKITEGLAGDEDVVLYVLLRDPRKGEDMAERGIYIYKGDITNAQSLKEPLAGKDVIIHCAALMSNFDSETRKRFYEVNALGTENMLNACDLKTLRQFIHISTVGIYGTTGYRPVSEKAPYGKVLSIYEWSKVQSELFVMKYAKDNNIPFTILRPAQLYGPGMYYGWLDTIKAIKSGKMLIPGKGNAKIHLLNVRDLVKAVKLALLNEVAINKIYNIAGPEISKLGEVFDIISEILGAGKPKRVPYLPAYMASCLLNFIPDKFKGTRLALLTPHRVRFFSTSHLYDISQARRELQYNPDVELKTGFRETVKWYEGEGLI